MKLQSKIKIILILFAILVSCLAIKSLAVSISVSPSVSSVEPGKSFSVTISGSDATGRVNISVSGGTASSSSVWIENNSQTITVTAGTSGTIKISASGELSSNSGEDKNVSGQATVAIVEPKQTTPDPAVVDTKPITNPGNTSAQKPAPVKTNVEEKKSSEATLKELLVAEGEISPEFNGNVAVYKLNVPNEVTSLNITATPVDSKAKVTIEGNENFVVGENKVTIKVIAEDGTTKEYIINVARKRTNLLMQLLKITYIDKDGNVKEIEISPTFNPSILEYKLDDISYLVNSLYIEAKANLEGATIEISGNDNLQEGENVITIKLTMKAEKAGEGEEQEEDEVVIYTITLNKEKEPTLWEKIKDKFKGIFGGIFTWYNNNIEKIVVYALAICIVSLIGLSVYIVIDYKKYKTLIVKLNKIEKINSSELAIETPTIQTSTEEDVQIMEEDIEQEENIPSKKGGKHF